MASVFLFVFFLLSHLLLLLSAQKCRPFFCGHLGTIAFPFANHTNPECGVFTLDCWDKHTYPYPKIQLEDGEKRGLYKVNDIIYKDNTIGIIDTELSSSLESGRCESLTNLTFPISSFFPFEIATPNQTLFKCNSTLNIPTPNNFTKMSCKDDYHIYYSDSSDSFSSSLSECSIIQLPKKPNSSPGVDELFALLTAEINLRMRVSDECPLCYNGGDQCKRGVKEKIYCEEECYKCFKKGRRCKAGNNGKLYCVDGKGNDLGITQQYLGRHAYIHENAYKFLFLFALYLFIIHVLLLFLFHAIIDSYKAIALADLD